VLNASIPLVFAHLEHRRGLLVQVHGFLQIHRLDESEEADVLVNMHTVVHTLGHILSGSASVRD